MRSNRFSVVVAIAAVAVHALTLAANAAVIFSESFENPDVPGPAERTDGWSDTDPAAWAAAGHPSYTGLADEATTTAYTFSTPYGAQAAWIYGNGTLTTTASILSDVLVADMNYTVTFNTAKPSNGSNIEYIVELLAGTTVLGSASGMAATSDMSQSDSISFTPDSSHADLGETLAIRLKKGTGDWHYNPLYDNLQLDATAAAGGPEPLRVDFNATNQDGGPHNQAGFEPYDAGHEVAADFDTKTYSAFGTTVSVTPDWPNTTDNRVQQMIDRGAGNDGNWDNADGDIDLLTDWLGIDTRTGSGGNGNWDGTTGTPTYMTLALGDLPAGTYDWKSFHHDTENVHGDFTVEISTDGGTTWTALPDGLMTDSTSGGSPDSSGFTPPGPWPGPDADLLLSTYETSFIADGTNDVLLRFAPLSNTAVHRQLWGINGFELTQAVVPEPSTFVLAALGLLGLGWFGWRRRRLP